MDTLKIIIPSPKSRSMSRSMSRSPKSMSPKSRNRFSPKSRTNKSRSPKSKTHKSRSPSSTTIRADSALQLINIELKMPKILSGKLNYTENIAKKMDKIFQMHEQLKPSSGGSYLLTNLFYLYLFKKYKMNCNITDKRLPIGFVLQIKNTGITAEENEHITQIAEQLFECIVSGQKIIIMPFIFNVFYNENIEGCHANLLIYRQNNGVLEHFEPHGVRYRGVGIEFVSSHINTLLEHLVKTVNKFISDLNHAFSKQKKQHRPNILEIRLLKSHYVCPIRGVQSLEEASTIPKNALIEPSGYCAAWSMFFAELCLKNPYFESKQIYDAIMEKTELYEAENDYLRNVIRGYTCYINNKIAKHFSRIFDEPLTAEKIHRITNAPSNNKQRLCYKDKMAEIMGVEIDTQYCKRNSYPDVKSRYIEFSQGILSETSSSSLKSESSSNKDFSPKIPDTTPPNKRFSPKSPDTTPPNKDFSPKSPDTTPPNKRFSPKSPDTTPPKNSMAIGKKKRRTKTKTKKNRTKNKNKNIL